MGKVFSLAWVAVFCLSVTHEVFASKRVALVVGNGAYVQSTPLANPVNDANLMEKTLTNLGFEVVKVLDASKKQMRRALETYASKIKQYGPDTVGLFYYAGHGVQIDGKNYLIPVDAIIQDEIDAEDESFSANRVSRKMADLGNELNFIILDACRNNPFSRGFRSSYRGLARMDEANGMMIIYSTSPGDVAADGKGRNSPFTEALSKAIQVPNITADQAMKKVRKVVLSKTNDQQRPWEVDGTTGSFYFNPVKMELSDNGGQGQSIPETMFWNTIKDSKDSILFEAYLKQYPNGHFKHLAHAYIDRYQQEKHTALEVSDAEAKLWKEAIRSNMISSYGRYVMSYPSGTYIDLADQNSWSRALYLNNKNAYLVYLQYFSNGKYSALARKSIQTLEASDDLILANEETMWKEAEDFDFVSSYARYVREYPEGRYVSLADLKSWQSVERANIVASYELYLKYFKNGSHRKVANAKIKLLKGEGNDLESDYTSTETDLINLFND